MKLPVKFGVSVLPMLLSYKQALAYGEKHMPRDLKAAGFKTSIFIGDGFLRINFGK